MSVPNKKSTMSHIKNCPRFDTGKTDWVNKCNFDFNQEFYEKF